MYLLNVLCIIAGLVIMILCLKAGQYEYKFLFRVGGLIFIISVVWLIASDR
jgi:hypothetical protein